MTLWQGWTEGLRCGLKGALAQTASSFCVPAQVVDAPRFAWRGVLLDVGRHFFPVPFILKVLDVCAFYKITRFHWHLTEDQARPGAAGRLPGLGHVGPGRQSPQCRHGSSGRCCPCRS